MVKLQEIGYLSFRSMVNPNGCPVQLVIVFLPLPSTPTTSIFRSLWFEKYNLLSTGSIASPCSRPQPEHIRRKIAKCFIAVLMAICHDCYIFSRTFDMVILIRLDVTSSAYMEPIVTGQLRRHLIIDMFTSIKPLPNVGTHMKVITQWDIVSCLKPCFRYPIVIVSLIPKKCV